MAKSNHSPHISLETFSQVVEAVYDCALDPSRWQDAVRMISKLSKSPRCVVGVHDRASARSELMVQTGYQDPEYWRLHEEKYKRQNPLLAQITLMPVGGVSTQAMLVDEDEFVESQFYREWFKPQGLRDSIALKILQTGQRMGLLVANRTEDYPRYGNAEVRLLSLLSPHICRAVTISDALSLKTIRSEALEATLNALASGVYLADQLGRIVFMNRAAEQQVSAGDAVRIDNDHMCPVDRVARAAVNRALGEAIADEADLPAGGATLALPGGNGTGLLATVLPLARGQRRNVCGAFSAMAAIFVQDPIVVPPLPGEAFARLYSLTGGELRVLLAMAPGLGVKEAAEVLGISETTAKTHLQRIYAKTNTSKQTELMHLFMSSAPPVRTS